MSSQDNINAFSTDNFRVSFSNIPTVNPNVKDLVFLYESMVKSITLPPYALEIIQSYYMGNVINQPVSKKNDQLDDISITFHLDENFLNYYNLFEYLQQMRYGDTDQPDSNQVRNTANKRTELFRQYHIDSIDILLLDSQRRTKKILSFKNCLIHDISSINLEVGVSERVPFTVNFKIEEVLLRDP